MICVIIDFIDNYMNSAQEHFNPSRMKIKVKPILKSKITPALKPSK